MESVVSMDYRLLLGKYRGKRVLVTGHTGFKGSWLCTILKMSGAEVTGYALEPGITPDLFGLADVGKGMSSIIGDVRDLDKLKKVFEACRPEIVFHLAAQPIVRESYRNPVDTYSTNVMGTVNVMECIRLSDSVKSVVNVTTDKVYENVETDRGYVEEDKLDGYDPYSNSKSCSELVTHSYISSFFREKHIAVSTCRAGNVIGGGDFEKERIVPDCIRAAVSREALIVRNPHAVRPYQHVLEPLFAYLLVADRQLGNPDMAGAYNIGPDEDNCLATEDLVNLFQNEWGEGFSWVGRNEGGPHEANLLRLDCHKFKNNFGWKQGYDTKEAVRLIVEWTRAWIDEQNVKMCMENQIRSYIGYMTEKGSC